MFYCLLVPIPNSNNHFLAYLELTDPNNTWAQTALLTHYQSRWENLLLLTAQSKINKNLKQCQDPNALTNLEIHFWSCEKLPININSESTNSSIPLPGGLFYHSLVTNEEGDSLLKKMKNQNDSEIISKIWNELHDKGDWIRNPFKRQTIDLLAGDQLLKPQTAQTSNGDSGSIKSRNQSDFEKEFEKNLKNLQMFYELIRPQGRLDSPIIAEMKEKIGVLESDAERFKPSGIDSEENLATWMKNYWNRPENPIKDLNLRGFPLITKTHMDCNDEKTFVLIGNRIYYPGKDGIVQLTRISEQYPLFITTSPRTAVIHEYEQEAHSLNPIKNNYSTSPEIIQFRTDQENQKREKDFVKNCINHVASKTETQNVIYLINGKIEQENKGVHYENADTYHTLGWEPNPRIKNPAPEQSGMHFHQLSKDKTQANADVEIIHLPTVNADPRHSIRIHEQDLMHLYKLAIRVQNGEPLITHCTEGFDRAARIALAIDLFLDFDEIFQEQETQPIDAIISRYINLRNKRAPGALPLIKQCEEAFHLAYAFQAIDIYVSALRQLKETYSETQKDFFDEFEKSPSTDAKIDCVKRFLDTNSKDQRKEVEKKDFILFEKILRERRLAERACLWEINPQLFLDLPDWPIKTKPFATWNAEQQKTIGDAKRAYMQAMLLEDYVVTLQHDQMVNVTDSTPMRSALLETGIVYKSNEDILKIKKIASREFPAYPVGSDHSLTKEKKKKVEEEADSKEQEDTCEEHEKGKEKVEIKTFNEHRKEEARASPSDKPKFPPNISINPQLVSSIADDTLSNQTNITVAAEETNLFTIESVIPEENKDQLLNTVYNHREEIEKYEQIETELKDILNPIKELEQQLVSYVYNRLNRDKTKAFLSSVLPFNFFGFFTSSSPELSDLADQTAKENIYTNLINHALWHYANKRQQDSQEQANSLKLLPGEKIDALYSQIEQFNRSPGTDYLTYAKIKDALSLIGEMHNTLYQIQTDAINQIMSDIANEIEKKSDLWSPLLNADEFETIKDLSMQKLKQRIQNDLKLVINNHRTENNRLEISNKFINRQINRFFPCISRLTKHGDSKWTLNASHYQWTLDDALDTLNELTPPSSPS